VESKGKVKAGTKETSKITVLVQEIESERANGRGMCGIRIIKMRYLSSLSVSDKTSESIESASPSV
jgi:hypothetical protein